MVEIAFHGEGFFVSSRFPVVGEQFEFYIRPILTETKCLLTKHI